MVVLFHRCVVCNGEVRSVIEYCNACDAALHATCAHFDESHENRPALQMNWLCLDCWEID